MLQATENTILYLFRVNKIFSIRTTYWSSIERSPKYGERTMAMYLNTFEYHRHVVRNLPSWPSCLDCGALVNVSDPGCGT